MSPHPSPTRPATGERQGKRCPRCRRPGRRDFVPVVKLFTPDAGATWLLTEIDPGDEDAASASATSALGAPRSAMSRSRIWRPCAAGSAFRSNATATSSRTGR